MDIADHIITRKTRLRDALARMDATQGRLLLITDAAGRLVEVVSDGDLRRLVLGGTGLEEDLTALPHRAPVTAPIDVAEADLAALFRAHDVNHIPLLDAAGRPQRIASAKATGRILLSTPHLGEAEIGFVQQAFDTNWIAPVGPNIDGFEADLQAFTGLPSVALSSGTAALHLALVVLDVGPGDHVFCSTMTFAASANPIRYQRAEPVFVDSAPGSWNMCPAALARAFEMHPNPKAVIVASLYGHSADMDPIKAVCDAHGVPIIEDAAEAMGATYKGRPAGTTGLLGVYSFNGNKIITTSGGGALFSHDPALVARAKFLSTQAKEPALHYEHRDVGYNYRMSNILAGVGRGQMKVLAERVARRRAIYRSYREGLADLPKVSFIAEAEPGTATQWLSCILLDGMAPTALIAGLDAMGIEARPVWKPMHQQPVFAGCAYVPHGANRSVADDLFARGVCLPSGTNMSDEDLAHILRALRSLLG